jgi:hypothetical protein
MHGVLAPVLRNAGRERLLVDAAAIEREAVARRNAATGFSLMLRQRAERVMRRARAAGLRATVVKGPVFADGLYADRALRRFTDIDVLVAPEDVGALGEALAAEGFTLREANPSGAPKEWKWVDGEHEAVAVEVQTDLVHAASLGSSLALRHGDLVGEKGTDDPARPAALLAVASIHGAAHQFDRLLHVVDICQAARRLGDGEELGDFVDIVERCGARFAAVAGLDLAARLFDEPRCRAIAAALAPVRQRGLARSVLSGAVVASTMSRRRPLHSWRRSLFREMLKRSGS